MLSSLAVFPFREIDLGYPIYNLTEILIHVPCFTHEKEIRVAMMKGTRSTKSPKSWLLPPNQQIDSKDLTNFIIGELNTNFL